MHAKKLLLQGLAVVIRDNNQRELHEGTGLYFAKCNSLSGDTRHCGYAYESFQ